jgi:hypothetical protein|nr:MAG TPA: hypothetical protein [Caudoviricetes sp.]
MPFTCLFNMLIAMRNRQVFFVCAVGLALILGSGGCSHGPSDSAVTVTQTVTPSNPTSMSATSTTISSSRAATPATQQVEGQLENAGGRAFPEVEEETYEPVPRMGPLSDLDFDAPPAVGFTGAPNGDPQPLDKTISYCMDDPSYQPGTTMFTDGTTGWTSYCAGT